MDIENQLEFNQAVIREFEGLKRQFDHVQDRILHLIAVHDAIVVVHDSQHVINESFNRRLQALEKHKVQHGGQ